jgi:nitrite reductase/ring-hydroxylating ferredoxin subunit/uncharacterized membrane protein
MPKPSPLLELFAGALERATVLDPPSDVLQQLVQRLKAGQIKDLLSGTPIGHPLHPAVVAVPIGSVVAAAVLDLTGGDRAASRRLVGLGILTSVPAAVTGLSDWADTSGAERRMGLVHAVANTVGLGLLAASWRARRTPGSAAWGGGGRGVVAPGTVSVLAGLGVLTFSGWLGGHLAYALGVGVDTNAFTVLPTEWTDACEIGDVEEDRPHLVHVDGAPVLVVRERGTLVAMSDRCTHRGGPLHEGTVQDGCVQCPWHSSRFDLTDGSVLEGPATRPQPVLETRVVQGRVQVRRAEPRALRSNPVH